MFDVQAIVAKASRNNYKDQLDDRQKLILRAAMELAVKASLLQEEGRFPTFSLAIEIERNEQELWTPRVEFKVPPLAEPKTVAKWASIASATTDSLILKVGEGDPAELRLAGVGRRPRMLPTPHFDERQEPKGGAFILTVFGPASFCVEGIESPIFYVNHGDIDPLPVGAPFSKPDVLQGAMQTTFGDDYPNTVAKHCVGRVLAGMVFAKQGGALCIAAQRDTEALLDANKEQIGNPLVPSQGLIDVFDWMDASQLLVETSGARQGIDATTERERLDFEDVVKDIVRLSTADGATILSRKMAPIVFGAKLPIDLPSRDKVAIFEVNADGEKHLYDPGSKGTRHKSAVSWVAAAPTKGRLAFVVSQDGAAMAVCASNREVFVHKFRPRLVGWHRHIPR